MRVRVRVRGGGGEGADRAIEPDPVHSQHQEALNPKVCRRRPGSGSRWCRIQKST